MEGVVSETIDGLAARLKRLEFYLSSDNGTTNKTSELGKLAEVEKALRDLQRKSPAAADLLSLQSKQPSLFAPSSEGPPFETQLAVVKASTPLIYSVHSGLESISQTAIPATSSFTNLVELSNGIADVEGGQRERERQLAILRRRSALLMQRWYEISVLGEAECWAEWEGRLLDVERKVRRAEARKRVEMSEEG